MAVEDNFDQVVPGALKHQSVFLGVIQRRCNEAGLGLKLDAVKPDRSADRVVMRGVVEAKPQFSLEVYSDPIGPALQVGWQLIAPDYSSNVKYTQPGRMAQASKNAALDKLRSDPSTARILSGLTQAFHQMIFLPTLQNLLDACAPPPTNGFLGAQ